MQASTALVLLLVGKHQHREGGLSTQDVAELLDTSTATTSRNMYYWADGHSQMPRGGHEYIDISVDPKDRRRRLLRLKTPKS